jgi:multimeric flavodoxin WrbA
VNIVLLNGSPKDSESDTLQFALYLAAQEREHRFTVVEVAKRFRGLERDPARFNEVMDQVAGADVVLWAFPLYYLLVSSGYKRFIELIFERNRGDAFSGRYALAMSTSIHFYDHTAHNYIRAVSEDLGMHDLFEPGEREHLLTWFRTMMKRASMGESQPRAFAPVVSQRWEYSPEASSDAARHPADRNNPTPDLVVVTDTMEGNTGAMVRRFVRDFAAPAIVDLSRIRMGPCLGCLKCGFNNRCAYEGTKDEFVPLFRDVVLPAKKIAFSGTVHDRYLSALWQRYLERTFVVTHQPRLTGTHVAFLISGSLSQNANTREILLSWAETNGATMHSVVTDEAGRRDVLDREIDAATRSRLRPARASHDRHDAYPFMRRQVQKPLKPGMVAPYRRVVRDTVSNQ